MKYTGHGRETMNLFHKKTSDNRGFTLIEAIAALVILGIVAAVVVGRGMSAQELIPQADIVKSHLRFAQLKALSDDTSASWGINFSAGTSYILKTGTADASIKLPGESSNSHAFPTGSGVTISGATVSFDSWGSPGNANIPITLSQGGSTITLTVSAYTGYITP